MKKYLGQASKESTPNFRLYDIGTVVGSVGYRTDTFDSEWKNTAFSIINFLLCVDLVLVGFQEVNAQPQSVLFDAVLSEDDSWTQNVR